jgi:hypothetical protein
MHSCLLLHQGAGHAVPDATSFARTAIDSAKEAMQQQPLNFV